MHWVACTDVQLPHLVRLYACCPHQHYGSFHIKVRRDAVFEDAFDAFSAAVTQSGPGVLRSKCKVTFVNEHGLEEFGVDGGGLFKEFMDTVAKRAFNVEVRWFHHRAQMLGLCGTVLGPACSV